MFSQLHVFFAFCNPVRIPVMSLLVALQRNGKSLLCENDFFVKLDFLIFIFFIRNFWFCNQETLNVSVVIYFFAFCKPVRIRILSFLLALQRNGKSLLCEMIFS